MENKTAMQELREDLVSTIKSAKDALLEIENETTRLVFQEVVRLTLGVIIKRIDDELLEMERKQQGYSEEEVKEKTLLAMIEIMQEYSIIKESSVVQFHEAWFNQIKKGED